MKEGQMPGRGQRDYPKQPVLAVGAVVFNQDAVLLVERGNPPARGEWAIPGGRVRLGETLRSAAQREVAEETGVRIRAGKPVFSFETIDRDDLGRVRFHYYIVDLDAKYLGGKIRPGDDALNAAWVKQTELAHMKVSSPTLKLLEDIYGFCRVGPAGK